MGTEFCVLCHDCKVVRALDKFGVMMTNAKTKGEMLAVSYSIESHDSYRSALLATFLWKHKDHRVTVDWEHNDALYEEPISSYHHEDFWSEPPCPKCKRVYEWKWIDNGRIRECPCGYAEQPEPI